MELPQASWSHWLAPLMGIVVLFGGIYLLLTLVGLAPHLNPCITETHKKIINLSGFDFEMRETDCSTLVKDASVSVFIAKTGEQKKTLLFKYDPVLQYEQGVYRTVLPSVRFTAPGVLSIAISKVSTVFFQHDIWESLSIDYDIGLIIYPFESAMEMLRNQP